MLIIKENSNEWNYMWKWLEDHPLNAGLPEPTYAQNQGEGWQYMGSFRNESIAVHNFRHRSHPTTNERVSLTLFASKDMTEEDVELFNKIN